MTEEESKEKTTRDVIEQTMIAQEFGEEVDWKTYAAGVTQQIEIQVGDMADFILGELGKIQEKSLKISDGAFMRRMQKLFNVNEILTKGMKQDIESTNAAETAMDDGENVRFFRREYVDEKKRTRYYFNAFPQKKIDKMVEAIMQGRIPQMPQGQMSPTPSEPPGMETI